LCQRGTTGEFGTEGSVIVSKYERGLINTRIRQSIIK
jgi:hypothetical protein